MEGVRPGAENGSGPISPHLVATLFDQLPGAPFFLKDRALRYVCVNKAMVELIGAGETHDIVGRTAHDFFSAEVARRYEDLDRYVITSRRPLTDQLERTVRKDGMSAWILFGRWPVMVDEEVVGVAAIARNLSASDRCGPELGRIAVAVRHIQDHFASLIDIAQLARVCGISISQLDRDFVSLLGIAPLRYQKKVRFEKAQELLRETELSIAEIAQVCGYSDQSAFTRAFTPAVGLSPRAFRRARA